MLNSQGEVIGINTAIRADAQGLGFAIPIETARRIADQLFAKGQADHPYLGIQMVNLNQTTREEINANQEFDFQIGDEDGILVVRVIPNSPAARAGLKAGDIIQQIGDRPVETSNQVQEQVDLSEIGTQLEVGIVRNGKSKSLKVKPSAFPQDQLR